MRKIFAFLSFSILPFLCFASNEALHLQEGVYGIVFLIAALLIGALVRFIFQGFILPFTVILLLIGMGLGALERLHFFNAPFFNVFNHSLKWAADIDPHLLLFVFLPILIFEAAFNMDLHTFKKTGVNSALLAIPGILLALGFMAGLVMLLQNMGFGFAHWTWPIALMFGAVISATDPVAVVAILKELGTSKRLGTLIEGESLLNDGTSLVIFMVLMQMMSGHADTNILSAFFVVSGGGILVGLFIGWIFLRWIKRVFKDALIEISAVIVAAYLTFYVAEYVCHVSGVLALVSLGIMVGGLGKALISPSVSHFMEEFWELAGFIANCIIFLIVGIIIASKTVFTLQSFILLGCIYIGIHASRGLMMLLFYPIMKKIGYGITKEESLVVWFGGLRGALALSLGLIFLGIPSDIVSDQIKNDFFFLICGTVTLTLVINATTAEKLIKSLGLTKLSKANQLINSKAASYLYRTQKDYIEEIKTDRYLKKAKWGNLNDVLPQLTSDKSIEESNISPEEKLSETRLRILEAEKSSYWHQYKDGLIGPNGIQKLSDAIDHIIDKEGEISLSDRQDLDKSWEAPAYLVKMSQLPLVKLFANHTLLKRLFDSYDVAVSMVLSQKKCLDILNQMKEKKTLSDTEFKTLEGEVQDNIIQGNTFIRNLKINHPVIFEEISTRQARRKLLQKERKTIHQMTSEGLIDSKAAQKMHEDLDSRVKKNVL